MAKNELSGLSFEQLMQKFKGKNPNWKAATSYEEILKRAKRGNLEIVTSKAKKLNDQWNVFFKYPEIGLFRDIRSNLGTYYQVNVVAADQRYDNYNAAIERMASFARNLYKDIIVWPDDYIMYGITSNKFDSSFVKTGQAEKEDSSKKGKDMIKQRYVLNKELLNKFTNDATPIEQFVPNMDGADKFLKYLKSWDIATLGDYITKVQHANKSKYFAFHNYCSKHNLLELYTQFRKNIGAFVSKGDVEHSTDLSDATLFDDDPIGKGQNKEATKRGVKDKKLKNGLPRREEGEDVYAWMNRLPCELYVKGSDSLKQIYAAWKAEKGIESKDYIETGFGDKEVNDWAEGEIAHYRQIVDEKRLEIEIKEEERKERERKEKLGATVKKKLGEVEDYHHRPTLFKKVERRRYLKHEDDDLNV